MERTKSLDLCKEYIHQICCIANLSDGGFCAVYELEQHRIELHNAICDLLGLDRIKSKQILSYLDEKIGLNYSELPTEGDLNIYANKLLDLLLEQKALESEEQQ